MRNGIRFRSQKSCRGPGSARRWYGLIRRHQRKLAPTLALGLLVVLGLWRGAGGPSARVIGLESSAEPFRTGSVISGNAFTIDGDTIRIGDRTKVRLSGVAAPERDEPGGPEATRFMKRLINGKMVRCQLNGKQSYDRMVGVCFLDGNDIGRAIIAEGLARDCPRYSGRHYSAVEPDKARLLPFPDYCR